MNICKVYYISKFILVITVDDLRDLHLRKIEEELVSFLNHSSWSTFLRSLHFQLLIVKGQPSILRCLDYECLISLDLRFFGC